MTMESTTIMISICSSWGSSSLPLVARAKMAKENSPICASDSAVSSATALCVLMRTMRKMIALLSSITSTSSSTIMPR